MTTATVSLPHPLVKPLRHPIRWMKNHTVLLVDAVVLAHVGMFMVVALYYALFETSGTMNTWWHHAVSNSDLRHSIRDVAEGVLGGFLAKAIVWNHFKKSHQKVGRVFNRLRSWHVPANTAAVMASVIMGVIGFTVAYYALHVFHVHAAGNAPTGSVWNRTETIWNSDWDKKIMGYVAAFTAARPLRLVFDNVQGWFVDRRVDLGKPVRWYHPPTFKARYNYLLDNPNDTQRNSSVVFSTVMVGGCVVGLGLAAWGWYILTYVA